MRVLSKQNYKPIGNQNLIKYYLWATLLKIVLIIEEFRQSFTALITVIQQKLSCLKEIECVTLNMHENQLS